MSRWPWVILTTALVAASVIAPYTTRVARAAPTSEGPTYAQEAEILWRDGQAAFKAGKFQDAANRLQRLVDRYPGHTGYLEAHLLLGRSYLELGSPESALRPLKFFVEGAARPADQATGRVSLGRAYLRLERYNEADLTAVENERMQPLPDRETLLRSLLIKTNALIGLNNDEMALLSLSSARKLLDEAANGPAEPSPTPRAEKLPAPVAPTGGLTQAPTGVTSQAPTGAAPKSKPRPSATPSPTPTVAPLLSERGEAAELALKLKLRSCDRLPSKGPLEEAQAREQLFRRGTCVQEALVEFRDTLETGSVSWSEDAGRDLQVALLGYAHACKNPPGRPGKATARQKQTYLAELRHRVLADCRAQLRGAGDLLRSFKFPPERAEIVRQLTRQLDSSGR